MTEGDTARFPQLAETYRRIAAGGAEIFYNGTLRDDILSDLQDIGELRSIISNIFFFYQHEIAKSKKQ